MRLASVALGVLLIASGFSCWMGVAQAASPDDQLSRAIHLFEQLDDEGSAAALRRLLATNPPGDVTAKAHLYLGLIAFNAFHPDEAREEFKRALRANAAIELPRSVSPKARLSFDEARREFATEMEAAAPRSQTPAPPPLASPPPETPAPGLAPVARVASPAAPEESHSHVLSLALGGAGVIAAGLAVFGGVEVAQDVSLVNSANSSPAGKYTSSQLDNAHANASPWAVGWIVCAAIAAAAGTAAVITW